MKLKLSSISDQNLRESNQDNCLILSNSIKNSKTVLCLVADGMGGLSDGEKASKIVKETFEEFFKKDLCIDAGFSSPEFYREMKVRICRIITEANMKIIRYGEEHGVKLGTTLVLLFIYNNRYIVGNVGDSRAYLFSRKAEQLTRDQTAAQDDIDSGVMTYEEAKTSRKSHILTQCLGLNSELDIDFSGGKFSKKDYFLLCSDGMYNRVEIDELEKIIRQKDRSTKKKLADLVIKAKENGESDNITGILIEA